MKRILSYGGIAAIAIFSLVFLFYFYLPFVSEPEGASLEVKSLVETQNELGFIPIVSTQAIFIPEPQNPRDLEAQLEKEKEEISATLNQEVEAAKKSKKKAAKGKIKYAGAPIPSNWQTMAPKVIELNLSAQRIYRWENGQRIDENLISSGKRGYDTPQGLFYTKNKIPLAYSRKYRLYMPNWMAFTRWGHGLHALPVFKNGKVEGAAHLGKKVSHGCVRTSTEFSKVLYDWADVGTPVIIHS